MLWEGLVGGWQARRAGSGQAVEGLALDRCHGLDRLFSEA